MQKIFGVLIKPLSGSVGQIPVPVFSAAFGRIDIPLFSFNSFVSYSLPGSSTEILIGLKFRNRCHYDHHRKRKSRQKYLFDLCNLQQLKIKADSLNQQKRWLTMTKLDKSEGDVNISARRKAWQENRINTECRALLDEDARFFLKQSLSTHV